MLLHPSFVFCFFFFNVYGLCLQLCLCTKYMPSVHGGQKKQSNPLELALQMVVSYLYGCLELIKLGSSISAGKDLNC